MSLPYIVIQQYGLFRHRLKIGRPNHIFSLHIILEANILFP